MLTFTDSGGNQDYSPYLTMFGGGMGATSQFLAGSQSSSLMRANAGVAALQSQSELEMGAEQAELYRQHLESRLGRQAASIGGAGITTSGSALRALQTTSMLGAEDINRIQTNAARKAWGFGVTEQGDLARAQMARNAGINNAFGGLITSGARAYGQWNVDS